MSEAETIQAYLRLGAICRRANICLPYFLKQENIPDDVLKSATEIMEYVNSVKEIINAKAERVS